MRVNSVRYVTPKYNARMEDVASSKPATITPSDDVVDVEYVELDGVDGASGVEGSDASQTVQVNHDQNSGYVDASNSANKRYAALTSYNEQAVFERQRGVERHSNPYSDDKLADYKRKMRA